MKENKLDISEELLKQIQDVLRRENRLYRDYRAIGKEVMQDDEKEVWMEIVEEFDKFKIKKSDRKLYSLPSVKDHAALVKENYHPRNIIVKKHDNHLERIPEDHPAVDPLTYPLLFIKGDSGWSPTMKFQSVIGQTTEEPSEFQSVIGQTTEEPSEGRVREGPAATDPYPFMPHKRIFLKTKEATITLFLYMNFMLHIRNFGFNLFAKGIYIK